MKKPKKKTGLLRHTLPRPKGVIECDVVLDVGAGIRPFNWYKPKHHVCIEPYEPYCELLEAAQFEVYQMTAVEALDLLMFDRIDAVYLLDVIEHMEKEPALHVLEQAKAMARVQVVIYTPWGFMEQTKDGWGLGGHSWQTHRSGWLPEEFTAADGWTTQSFRPDRHPHPQGLYAIWTNPTQN